MSSADTAKPAGVPASPGISAPSQSLASSAAFKTFAIVFSAATAAIYVLCEVMNWPLFTYHPGTNRLDLGFARPRPDEGPAMHWYGWTATALLGAGVLGVLATFLPESATRRIPLALTWLVPLLAVPILFYALMPFWVR